MVEIGVRLYVPDLGRFLQVDPIEGGGANDYSWPTGPINGHDPSGERWQIDDLVSTPSTKATAVMNSIRTSVASIASASPSRERWINPKAVSGTINLIWGSAKIGLGIVTLIKGAPLTFNIGTWAFAIPAVFVGGFNVVTGLFKAIRGTAQINDAIERPFVGTTPSEWGMDVLRGMLPSFTEGIPGFVGGF